MRSFLTRCITLATLALIVSACGGDSPTAPVSGASPIGTQPVTSSVISNDLAVSAGNSIASDLESLNANEVAAGVDVGALGSLFDMLPSFDGNTASSTPSTATCTFDAATKIYTCILTKPETGWECKLNTTTNLFTCTKKQNDPPPTPAPAPTPPPTSTPTPSLTNSCTYDSATRIYTCIKTAPDTGWDCVLNATTKLYLCTKKVDAPPAGTPTTPTPAPKPTDPSHPSEVCLLDPVTHLYTCTKSNHDSSTTVRSYGYFDIDGNPMATFVKGTTASIRYITRFDGIEAHDSSYKSVSHQLRDLLVSGFLGATRIWNGAGSSTDTTVHREGASSRTYTGTSVDTLKAVTYAEERSANPYPLSGTHVRAMNYTVVSIGKATETTTVSQRAVVTFNGTKDVPIQLGVFTCTLHLDTHKVDACK
jgi:hypothetical protein